MDNLMGKVIKETMGAGEKKAPVSSIKLKVKFQKAKTNALRKKLK